jgi:hypothetical protein
MRRAYNVPMTNQRRAMQPEGGYGSSRVSRRNKLLGAVSGVGLVLVAALLVLTWISNGQPELTATGQVLATRIVLDHTSPDRFEGSMLYYRIEAEVRFMVHGEQHEGWLKASSASADRTMLAMKLASHPARCTVYWAPGHLDNAKCRLP